jgi:MoaA/NifB/PqqE/SkfB family radical SAM enzyme
MRFRNKSDIQFFAARKRFPLSVSFQLTFRCNFKCLHCYLDYPHTGKELSFAEIHAILKQLAKAGTLYANFTGGEIFMRKDAVDILEAARKLDFAVGLFTNASLITEEIAERISRLHPWRLRVTLYGASEKMYRRVTGKSGMFLRTLKGIRLLIKYKVPLSIGLLIFNFYSVEEILAMKKICDGMGVPIQRLDGFKPKLNGDIAPLKYSPSESQLKEFSLVFPNLFSIPKSIKKAKNEKVCNLLLWSRIWLSPYGQIGDCDILVTKSTIREKPILEIWEKDPLLQEQRRVCWGELSRDCLQCDSFIYCTPCPAINFLSTGSFVKIPSSFCKEAKIEKRAYESLYGRNIPKEEVSEENKPICQDI